MQRGTVRKHHGAWTLFYYDTLVVNGAHVRKKVSKKLANVGPDYPNKRSVLLLAEKILQPINNRTVVPESSLRLVDFIDNHYFPHARKALRPSTVKGYEKDIYELHLRKRLGDIRVRDFRTVTGQRLIAKIEGPGHKTLMRIKSFLSGVFTYALREGVLDGVNPMHGIKVPGRPKKFRGEVYSLQEINDTLIAVVDVDKAAYAAIAVAAFGGLRLSEIRGLRWADYDGMQLKVARSVWRTHVGPTKTEESEAGVPVLPLLKKILDKHKALMRGQPGDYIFKGERRGGPLNLHNMVRRVIKPALIAYNTETKRDVVWKGWHSFRRGLASLVYELGVKPKVIQAILRHSDIGTTLQFYVETPEAESRAALQKFEEGFTASLEAEVVASIRK